MNLKKNGYIFFNESLITVLIYVILFSGGISLGYCLINNHKADLIVQECVSIDTALIMYSKSHQQIVPGSIQIGESGESGESKLNYQNGPIYPQNLSDLGIIQKEFGYFSRAIDLSKFSYTVKKKSDGRMTYELGVTMPNGNYYQSPNSNQ